MAVPPARNRRDPKFRQPGRGAHQWLREDEARIKVGEGKTLQPRREAEARKKVGEGKNPHALREGEVRRKVGQGKTPQPLREKGKARNNVREVRE